MQKKYMPREMLYSDKLSSIVESHLNGKDEWEKREVSVKVGGSNGFDMNVVYFYNNKKEYAIIPSPLATQEGTGDAQEPSYQATMSAISKQVGNETFGVGCSLVGKGSGERHYTALYKEVGVGGKISIFDSKISDPNKFLNSSDAPSFLEKAWGIISAPFKSFGLWAFGIGKQTEASFSDKNMTINRLGTQPMFDGVSCGLHSTGAVLDMLDSIDKGKLTINEVGGSLTSKRGLDLNAEKIHNEGKKNVDSIPAMSPSLMGLSRDRSNSNLATSKIESKNSNEPNENKKEENLYPLRFPG